VKKMQQLVENTVTTHVIERHYEKRNGRWTMTEEIEIRDPNPDYALNIHNSIGFFTALGGAESLMTLSAPMTLTHRSVSPDNSMKTIRVMKIKWSK
jgi:hypothetical protein